MRVVCDIEANGLEAPTQIWVICCLDIDTGDLHIFRKVTSDETEKEKFLEFARAVTYWVGHNFMEYDYPVLRRLLGLNIPIPQILDTLIISKLVNFSRKGHGEDEKKNKHSLEDYGLEFGSPKHSFDDFSQYSQAMEDYCVQDTRICLLVYQSYLHIINSDGWRAAIQLEHEFQYFVVNALQDNGFYFNADGARRLLAKVLIELGELDAEITKAFPARLELIREVHPRLTKHGTLSKTDFRWVVGGDLSEYNGGPFSRGEWVDFNPSSHRQIIRVLNEAGWKPFDKTKTHVDTEREYNRNKVSRKRDHQVDLRLQELYNKLQSQSKTGWKVNEANLETLPATAPGPARTLAKRILLESRRRTLTEWLELVESDNRIHGKFYGLGAWTGRMSHQKPNTANIPNAVKISDGSTRLLGKELRSLWCAPKKRLLVGVDAEAIQFRGFAHFINDPVLIHAIVHGNKKDKTDPHSLNKEVFGVHCKTRNASKHSMFAIFFGGRANKVAQIMGCTKPQAEDAIRNLLNRYTGLARLEREVFPVDAKRGYFIGIDGRQVPIPDPTESGRKHLCMSGYLQSFEAIVMKKASLLWRTMLMDDKELREFVWFIINLIHDEWQTETGNDMRLAIRVAKTQANSLRIVGEQLNLNCPLAGSYYNEDIKDYTIGTNWYQTH